MDTIINIDYRLHILWRMWRNDRIAGDKAATRRDLVEFDKLLDQRLIIKAKPKVAA